MEKHAKIYVAGHRGMVGSAIVRKLQSEGYHNFVFRKSAELDLRNQEAVKDFFEAEKPIAAICHGPWTLINAEVVEGRQLTSYPTLRKDLENAGAKWTDKEVVVDNGLITSRNPNDIPAFNKKLIEEIAEGKHGKQMTANQ